MVWLMFMMLIQIRYCFLFTSATDDAYKALRTISGSSVLQMYSRLMIPLLSEDGHVGLSFRFRQRATSLQQLYTVNLRPEYPPAKCNSIFYFLFLWDHSGGGNLVPTELTQFNRSTLVHRLTIFVKRYYKIPLKYCYSCQRVGKKGGQLSSVFTLFLSSGVDVFGVFVCAGSMPCLYLAKRTRLLFQHNIVHRSDIFYIYPADWFTPYTPVPSGPCFCIYTSRFSRGIYGKGYLRTTG